MNSLKVGVVGVGSHGQHHARVYAQLKGAALVGVADVNLDRSRQVAGECGCAPYADHISLAEQCDALSVVVPTEYHFSVARDLLEMGKHVLLEKPIARSLEEADELVSRAGEKRLVLQVGHVERFNVAVRELASVISKPRFIEVHRLSPFTERAGDVGVVLDLMLHDLDIVLSLVKSPVERIEALGVPVLSAHEDIANARLRFANGCVANLTASRVSMDRMRKIRVFQESAYLSLDYVGQSIKLYRKRDGAALDPANPMQSISVEDIRLEREEPLKLELQAFLDCIRSGERPLVSGEDGREALRVALDILSQLEGF